MPDFIKRFFKNIPVFLVFLFFFSGALLFLAVKEPDSLSGTIYLQIIYRTLGPKAALALYNGTLEMSDYRHLPAVSDRFLVRTLLDGATSEEEQSAILNFYLERSAYGLSQHLWAHKGEVARKLLSRLATYDQKQHFLALRLLEELATGSPLPKEQVDKMVLSALPNAAQLFANWQEKQERPIIALGDE